MKKLLIILIVLVAIALIAVKTGLLKKKQDVSAVVEKTIEKTTEKAEITETLKEEYRVAEKKEKTDPFVKPKYLTDLEKENQALKAEIAELKQKIWFLQTQTEIRSREDLERTNEQIAALNERIEFLESQQYEEVYQEPYYYEPPVRVVYSPSLFCPWSWINWYSDCYYYWRWRVYWAYYPYGYLGLYLGWHPGFGWARSLGYYYDRHYGYYDPYYYGRDSGYYGAQRVVSKSQLKRKSISRYSTGRDPTSSRVISTNKRSSQLSKTSSSKIYSSRISKGKRIDPLYTLPRSQRPSSKTHSLNRKSTYQKSYSSRLPRYSSKVRSSYRIRSTPQSSRISSGPSTKAPSRSFLRPSSKSYSSFRSSRSIGTTKVRSTKIRKK